MWMVLDITEELRRYKQLAGEHHTSQSAQRTYKDSEPSLLPTGWPTRSKPYSKELGRVGELGSKSENPKMHDDGDRREDVRVPFKLEQAAVTITKRSWLANSLSIEEHGNLGIVESYSRGGIGVNLPDDCGIEVGEEVVVTFKQVSVLATVRHITSNNIGSWILGLQWKDKLLTASFFPDMDPPADSAGPSS